MPHQKKNPPKGKPRRAEFGCVSYKNKPTTIAPSNATPSQYTVDRWLHVEVHQ